MADCADELARGAYELTAGGGVWEQHGSGNIDTLLGFKGLGFEVAWVKGKIDELGKEKSS